MVVGGGGGGGSLFPRRQVPLNPRQHPTALSVPPFAWSCAIKSAGCLPVLLFADPQSSCIPQNSCTSFAVTQPLIGELLAKKGEWAVGVVQIRAKNVGERETGGAGGGLGGGGGRSHLKKKKKKVILITCCFNSLIPFKKKKKV